MFKANFQNLLYFVGRLAPMMMIFFFVFISIVNQEWRGFIYLIGVIVACFLAIILSNTFEAFFDTSENAETIPLCSFTDKQYSKFPLSSVILGFTVMYLFFPMIKVYGNVTNPYLFAALLLFVFVDIMFLKTNKCAMFNITKTDFVNSLIPISISYAVGAFVAHVFVMLMTSTNNAGLLYFGTNSASPLCKVAENNRFKCKVYKNGELLTTN